MKEYRKWTKAGIGAILALLLSGCTEQHRPPAPPSPSKQAQRRPVPVQSAPPTPIEAKRVQLGGPTWNPQWDKFIERSLPAAMLSWRVPRDVRRFCPRFFEMDRTQKRAYWAYFFQALAAAEAGLNTKTVVPHDGPQTAIDRVTGLKIRSEGLLQLAYEDEKRYGCNFNWKVDRRLPRKDPHRTILQPENNLACGIKILDDQIIRHRKPLFTGSSYWSTLRPGTESYQVFAKQMTNPPAACGLHERRVHRRAGGSREEARTKNRP